MSQYQINQSLSSFLIKKELFYDKIDYSIILNAWDILKSKITLPFVIHIVGTNGKGSTGRYLASFLEQLNFSVLHYSSPHILKFNERIWIDGDDSKDEQLDSAHKKLLALLPKEICNKLTYFEYTTLVAFVLSDHKDYLVLEAGLGGEFDATNIVTNDLSLITTIGLDHTEFLGDTIEKIATTKMRSCDSAFILGQQIFNIEVENVKNNILKIKKEIQLQTNIGLPSEANNLPKYLQNNLRLALSALDYLKLNNINLKLPVLFGRCQKLDSNIVIDVGHNSLAATVLLKQFKNQKLILIYNSYKDKDYELVLKILKPIILEVQIIKIKDKRIANFNKLSDVCSNLSITVKKFDRIDKNNKYLVFGSFKVVEEFVRYKENLEY